MHHVFRKLEEEESRTARRDELVDRLDLGEFLTTPVRQRSLGQRIRGEIAAALLHSPTLLVLDEPTIGLDVLSKEQLRVFARSVSASRRRSRMWSRPGMTPAGSVAATSRPRATPASAPSPCDLVVEAIGRPLPGDAPPDALVFTVSKAKGERGPLTRYQLRQVYQRALPDADLPELDLRGPHDLRHTFATWLEDEGNPARVIDELMGHEGGQRGEHHGSRIGTRYRHTTTGMLQRVRDVLNARLQIVLKVAEHEEPAAAQRRPNCPPRRRGRRAPRQAAGRP